MIDKINEINRIYDDYWYGLGGPGDDAVPELIRLHGGSLLKDIIDRMKHKISCLALPTDASCASINRLKYYAYSGVKILARNLKEKLF